MNDRQQAQIPAKRRIHLPVCISNELCLRIYYMVSYDYGIKINGDSKLSSSAYLFKKTFMLPQLQTNVETATFLTIKMENHELSLNI